MRVTTIGLDIAKNVFPQLRRYWTNACRDCVLKPRCTTGKERRITRREHEHVLEAVQKRLDNNPQAMRRRRETVEHPFGTLKMRMGGDALPDEAPAEGRHRSGTPRARLQPYPRDEHHGHPAAHDGDQGIV